MKPTETQVGGDHYREMAIQPATFILKNGIPFHEGSAIKYLCRWRKKGGVEDLKKAQHFIDMLIEDAEAVASSEWEAMIKPTTDAPPKRKAIWHNPDNLESAGEGYRFLVKGVETQWDATHFWSVVQCRWYPHFTGKDPLDGWTYRTNKPLPEGWEA